VLAREPEIQRGTENAAQEKNQGKKTSRARTPGKNHRTGDSKTVQPKSKTAGDQRETVHDLTALKGVLQHRSKIKKIGFGPRESLP
jgi:hypothetical protein